LQRRFLEGAIPELMTASVPKIKWDMTHAHILELFQGAKLTITGVSDTWMTMVTHCHWTTMIKAIQRDARIV
jgi:hypothetical protein